MKIGLIADVHGNYVALKAVWNAIANETDSVFFLGDLCGYYPFVEECASVWDAARVIGIRGNHDQIICDCLESGTKSDPSYKVKYGSALDRTLQDLDSTTRSMVEAWPASRSLSMNHTHFSLFHGAPWEPLQGRVYPDFEAWEQFADVPGDVIVLGHTHYPLVKQYKDKLIINPGSVGQPRDRSSSASYAIINTGSGRVQHHRISFDPRAIIEDASEFDPTLPYLVEVLTR